MVTHRPREQTHAVDLNCFGREKVGATVLARTSCHNGSLRLQPGDRAGYVGRIVGDWPLESVVALRSTIINRVLNSVQGVSAPAPV